MCKQRVPDFERTPPATPHERRQAFIGHALTFALVIGGLAALNLATSPHYPWFLWPLFGWGIGLAKQGLALAQAQFAEGGGPTLTTPRGARLPEEPRPSTPEESARPWPDLD